MVVTENSKTATNIGDYGVEKYHDTVPLGWLLKKSSLTESYGELIVVHVDKVSNLKTCSNQIFALLEQERLVNIF